MASINALSAPQPSQPGPNHDAQPAARAAADWRSLAELGRLQVMLAEAAAELGDRPGSDVATPHLLRSISELLHAAQKLVAPEAALARGAEQGQDQAAPELPAHAPTAPGAHPLAAFLAGLPDLRDRPDITTPIEQFLERFPESELAQMSVPDFVAALEASGNLLWDVAKHIPDFGRRRARRVREAVLDFARQPGSLAPSDSQPPKQAPQVDEPAIARYLAALPELGPLLSDIRADLARTPPPAIATMSIDAFEQAMLQGQRRVLIESFPSIGQRRGIAIRDAVRKHVQRRAAEQLPPGSAEERAAAQRLKQQLLDDQRFTERLDTLTRTDIISDLDFIITGVPVGIGQSGALRGVTYRGFVQAIGQPDGGVLNGLKRFGAKRLRRLRTAYDLED